MPLVALFDGASRRVILDSSVIDSQWSPIDIYREHRKWRLLESSRGWSPLVSMSGGAPKGGGAFEARSLVLLTDDNGLTTKLVVPDHTSGYRTLVNGEIRTDVADVDPEVFDVSATSVPAIIDYKPPSTEIVSSGIGGGLTIDESEMLERLYMAHYHRRTRSASEITIFAADGLTPLYTFSTDSNGTLIDPQFDPRVLH